MAMSTGPGALPVPVPDSGDGLAAGDSALAAGEMVCGTDMVELECACG